VNDMRVYDLTPGEDRNNAPPEAGGGLSAVICAQKDVAQLQTVFGWDGDTLDECTNLDETVRYTSYNGYDFVSLIYAEPEAGVVCQREINVFFSKRYLVLVLPEEPGDKLNRLAAGFKAAALAAAGHPAPLTRLYYHVFDALAADFAETLEALEDEMETLSEAITVKSTHAQIAEIGRLRKNAYTFKKILRALSYIGGQIVFDENRLIAGDYAHYFRGVDARFMKLSGFADSLYDLSNELLRTYDSKFSAQMNETVNKLTVITLFFGPLTVITGVYGMNFTNMPELDWRFGYPAAIALMFIVCVIIYIVMKKKKWL
jgi:magnesium transporter